MEGISEFAKLFKERDNKPYLGPQLGTVQSKFPDIKISLGDNVLLTKKNLYFSSHITKHFEREFEIEAKEVKFEQEMPSITKYQSKGKIKYKDVLKKGDKVILIPTTDEQKYYVIDKVVKV
ncbi:DUF2577 domain-containing protein [Clostridiaceae bacterium M8S5]|nr:DUF2577 domain-containing protein [Clostridiaceae bacterium M8S5]